MRPGFFPSPGKLIVIKEEALSARPSKKRLCLERPGQPAEGETLGFARASRYLLRELWRCSKRT